MIDELLLVCFFILVVGACIGSFLNVVALRAISKESIVFPSSKCPFCNEPIKWFDNIPVLSYFFTFKGKCRNCGEKVSIQYPIVEALTAILFLAVFLSFGLTVKTLLLWILLSISIVIIITDLKNEEAKKFLNDWWNEFISTKSLRDQISLQYVVWKNKKITGNIKLSV